MVRIRFRRVGSKNQATFRIVAADRESPRDGRFLEVLGHYNPRTEPSTIKVDEARLFHWMKNGAQPSESVHQALRALGTWDRWERYKNGEDIELLMKEAEAAQVEVDPRTRRDDLIGERKMKSKARKKAAETEAAAAEPAAEEEPGTAEAVEETEAVAEAEAEEPTAVAEADETAAQDEAKAEAEPAEEEAVQAAEGADEPEAVEETSADEASEPAAEASPAGDAEAEPEVEAKEEADTE